jgi:hypothetical protein
LDSFCPSALANIPANMKIELWQIEQAPHPASSALQGTGVSKLLLIKVPKGLSSFLKPKFLFFLQPAQLTQFSN